MGAIKKPRSGHKASFPTTGYSRDYQQARRCHQEANLATRNSRVSKVTHTTIPNKKYWAIVTDFITTSKHDKTIKASGALPRQRRQSEQTEGFDRNVHITRVRRTLKGPPIIKLQIEIVKATLLRTLDRSYRPQVKYTRDDE